MWQPLRSEALHLLALGANNCGKGGGDGTVRRSAFISRFHLSDLEIYSHDSVDADWTISVLKKSAATLSRKNGGQRRGRSPVELTPRISKVTEDVPVCAARELVE